MLKKLVLLPVLLLASCISVAVADTPVPAPQGFVTSTLPPTKSVYVPATLTPTPDITATPKIEITIPPDCKNGAVLLRDVTIPDGTKMKAGEKFAKIWEFQNAGSCPWLDYQLKFAAGDQMDAPLSAPVPLTLPGEQVEVSVELIAPSASGAYTGYFTLNTPDGKDLIIGTEKTFWVKIVVGD